MAKKLIIVDVRGDRREAKYYLRSFLRKCVENGCDVDRCCVKGPYRGLTDPALKIEVGQKTVSFHYLVNWGKEDCLFLVELYGTFRPGDDARNILGTLELEGS